MHCPLISTGFIVLLLLPWRKCAVALNKELSGPEGRHRGGKAQNGDFSHLLAGGFPGGGVWQCTGGEGLI